MANESAEMMSTESSGPVVDVTLEPRGGEDAARIREIAEVGPSSPVGEVDESTTSNVIEIVSQAGMGTVKRDLDITVP